MCGIAGIVERPGEAVSESLLIGMRDVMSHRGPDDAGIFVDGPVGLAHRRLSIIDLSSAGHQPMPNEDQSLWLIFNGEIYNFIELRRDLEERGHRFSTSCDSEVLIHAYQEFGERCVDHLDGMFAFAIWDRRTRTLFAARDRIGIKPFYYCWYEGRLGFASEIKAILEDPRVPRRPDRRGLADYLFVAMPLGHKTLLEHVHQLPPGYTLTLRDQRLETRPYWDVRFDYDTGRSLEDTHEAVRTLVDDAVRIHCRSDAPLGCHLSGGVDTSAVTGFAARHYDPLKVFAIRSGDGALFDETPYARAVAQHTGATYVEGRPGALDLSSLLPALVWHMDLPMPNIGGFSYFTVSALAAGHVKVALTGHGGDEVFAGYPAQFQAAFGTTDMFPSTNIKGWKLGLRQRLMSVLRREGLSGITRRVAGRLRTETTSLDRLWMQLHTGSEPKHNPLLSRAFVDGLGGYTPATEYLAPLHHPGTEDLLDRCLYHDLRVYLPGLLTMEDRASMAVSLESRVPLLDHRVVELLATIPSAQKVAGNEPKHLLRSAAAPHLPQIVRDRRDKAAFFMPLHQWLQNELRDLVDEILGSRDLRDRNVFDPAMLRRDALSTDQLWMVLNVELWFRLMVDGDRQLRDRAGVIEQYRDRSPEPVGR